MDRCRQNPKLDRFGDYSTYSTRNLSFKIAGGRLSVCRVKEQGKIDYRSTDRCRQNPKLGKIGDYSTYSTRNLSFNLVGDRMSICGVALSRKQYLKYVLYCTVRILHMFSLYYVGMLIFGHRFHSFVIGRLLLFVASVSATVRCCWLLIVVCQLSGIGGWLSMIAVDDNFDWRCPAMTESTNNIGFKVE